MNTIRIPMGHDGQHVAPEPDGVTTTFTSWCSYGCVIRVVESAEQPHVCVGEQVISALAPDLSFAEVQRIAAGLQPLLNELKADSWEDGVRSGRRGPCYGVDPVVPEGHVDDVGCPCGPMVHPVAGLMHTLVADGPPVVELPVEPGLAALAWHDAICPEGPDCRDRPLHAASPALTCDAQIWPSWSNQWIRCGSPVRANGKCVAYLHVAGRSPAPDITSAPAGSTARAGTRLPTGDSQ